MNKKKVVSLLLATMMLGGVLAGCATTAAAPAASAEPAKEEAAAPAAEGEAAAPAAEASGSGTPGYEGDGGEFSMYLRSTFIDWINDLEWYKVAEERTGVHVNYQRGADEEDATYPEIDQMVLSGTLTDCALAKQDQANVYGMQGAFYNLKPLIEQYAPHIQAYLADHPDYEKLITAEDGAIYGLLTENANALKSSIWFYRADHFEKAGVDPASIKNVDDLTDALRTLKEYYKDVPNYYPLNGREEVFRFITLFNCGNSADDSGVKGFYYNNVEWGFDPTAAYDMVETMKLWYDEGLINPEWVAGAFSEGDWEGAMWEGRGSVSYDFYTRPASFNISGKDYDPDYNMQILDFIADKDGNPVRQQTPTLYNEKRATVININASEETAKDIIQWIDYFYSEEGQTLANWGVEGVSYEETPEGRKFLVSYNDELAKPDGTMEWSFLSDRFTVCKPVEAEAFFSFNDPAVAEASVRLFTEENLRHGVNIIYNEEEATELATLTASLVDMSKAGMVSFITGKTELNEENWQKYVDDLKAAGYDRVIELQTEAYNNTYK